MVNANLKKSEKYRSGRAHHYGAVVMGIGTLCKILDECVSNNSIHEPELEKHVKGLVARIYSISNGLLKTNNREETLSRLERRLDKEMFIKPERYYLIKSLILLEESFYPIERGNHPFLEHLKEIKLPIHLRKGLISIKVLANAIQNLYNHGGYWEGIPLDKDTKIFYDSADIFHKGIQDIIGQIEFGLKLNDGLSELNKEDIQRNLRLIETNCKSLSDLGLTIEENLSKSQIEEGKNRKEIDTSYKWNLLQFDPYLKYVL